MTLDPRRSPPAPGAACLIAALALGACAPAPEPPAPEPERRPTVIDPQLQALDKAKGVESQVLDASRRSIDEADADSR